MHMHVKPPKKTTKELPFNTAINSDCQCVYSQLSQLIVTVI